MIHFDELKDTDFFSFFNLGAHEEHPLKDGSVLRRFKPGKFKEFVDIGFTTDPSREILKATLFIDRAWLGDEKHISPFAKDIAKSFITDMVPRADQGRVKELVLRLWHLRGKGDRVRSVGPPPPELRRPLSSNARETLEVFLGWRPVFELSMDSSRLVIGNLKEKGKELLKIEIRPQEQGRMVKKLPDRGTEGKNV